MLSSNNRLHGQSSHRDHYGSSGSSPTPSHEPVRVHLFGVGLVGSALLERLPSSCRLVAVTDSTATVSSLRGLDPLAIRDYKRAGRPLAAHARGRIRPLVEALECAAADLVVDAMPSDPRRSVDHARWAQAVVKRGQSLALASKQGLRRVVERLLEPDLCDRVGCNAVLGGTGRQFQRELGELRQTAAACAIAGSATTTLVIDAIERGGRLEDGIESARRRGILEPDPELDFLGEDAAVKLAIVAGALWGVAVDPSRIPREDLRDLDPDWLAERARRGATTRLIARGTRAGELALRYEELSRAEGLAIAQGEVAYAYELDDGSRRVHRGRGVGPDGTADALRADIDELASAVLASRGA